MKRSSRKPGKFGWRRTYAVTVALAGFAMCSGPFSATTPFSGARSVANIEAAAPSGVATFPELARDSGQLAPLLMKALKKSTKAMSPDELQPIVERLRHYLLFLGLNANDFKKAARQPAPTEAAESGTPAPAPGGSAEDAEGGEDDGDSTPSNLKAILRLFQGSTQFLFCDDLTDASCLEQRPKLAPLAAFRLEGPSSELGSPRPAGASLDMDVFFTEGWDGSPRSGVVDRLAERLRTDVGRSLSIAMYGIDDVQGSMKPVYDAIDGYAHDPTVKLRTVVDVSGLERATAGPWLFDYVAPASADKTVLGRWLFSPGAGGAGMHATFQYDGTPGLIRELDGGISDPEQARLRLEWPSSHIMHNKFAVLEGVDGRKSVWSGTANFSNHCMGTEANSNMSIYIRNDAVAQAFLDEFDHMYEFDPTLVVKSRLVSPVDPSHPIRIGRFHHNKRPVSHRHFVFEDGTRVRVHFAPTDDAEHRVILPMLLSAREGDELRVSMFGGTGFEIVRAMQFAAAKGANVRIVFDAKLGHGQTSWIRDPILNLTMPNPYVGKVAGFTGTPGKIDVRLSTWPGKNHYKAGTLTRRKPDGRLVAEELIVGSQNWSSGGNDHNDENLVSIQNLTGEVDAARRFNAEFDSRLWAASKPDWSKRRGAR